MKIGRFLPLIVLTLLILAGCGGDEPVETIATPTSANVATNTELPPTNTPISSEPIRANAPVDSIEILILESFPVQINVRAQGELSDGCTTIDDVTTTSSGNTFDTTITTLRESGQLCTEAVVPYEELIPLDVNGLPAGTYTVSVNGITGSFTLAVDNVAGAEPTAVPAPTDVPAIDGGNALVNGRVWHDLCAVAEGEGDEAATPSEGCIATDENSFQANSLLEDEEPGLSGIVVNLGEGACPADGLATTTTDEDGDYVFTDLMAGTYCVSVDALATTNTDNLLPGGWTFPESGDASTTVALSADAVFTGVNFGWDYQFLPAPVVNLETCTNSIEFVQDLNIPDDMLFAPGESFEKGWRIRNNGTCPWTTEYSLAFVGEDQMGAESFIPLTAVIVPGQTVDVTAAFIAPEELGTYRSNWQISNADDQPFGVNGLLEEAFWVQIEVGVPAATPEPNTAVIGGVVWEDVCFFDADSNPNAGCAEIEDSGFYRADGSLNFNEGRLVGVVVTLSQEACAIDGAVNPADVITTTTTDEQGLYRFTGLDEGTYCVTIDAVTGANVNLLIPGDWTWPAYGVGRQGVLLDAGEELLEIDFGWQYSN
ncbi:MAG: hypothetical protein GY943_19950 [Chloroflexi bacterium]|nr:hypothetical protein [Chloroflexota bacterium]